MMFYPRFFVRHGHMDSNGWIENVISAFKTRQRDELLKSVWAHEMAYFNTRQVSKMDTFNDLVLCFLTSLPPFDKRPRHGRTSRTLLYFVRKI